MCFLSAWVVLLWWDGFRFTWWATLAALIWVRNEPSNTCLLLGYHATADRG